ncbi:MAG TPA: antibiotic biosynthesis monooxygenase family protein [Chloroflexota bacterium]|jgi:heme-degrading monooxygenase HmoA
MYGTVARMRLKAGAEEQLRTLMKEYDGSSVPGFKGQLVYRSDRDPSDYFLAVVFESKDAYLANAGSPEQHQRYLRYRELLDGEPEWHDGEIVFSSL